MDPKDYFRRRADKVNERVSIFDVLRSYDILLPSDEREVQYPCPLHGDGNDRSFSARVYPHSNSTHCFACHKTRDPIEWVRDKEQVGFMDAIKKLEERWDIEPPPVPDGVFDGLPDDGDRRDDRLEELLIQMSAAAPSSNRVRTKGPLESLEKRLRRAIRSRSMEMDQALKLSEVVDGMRWDWEHDEMESDEMARLVAKVKAKLNQLTEA